MYAWFRDRVSIWRTPNRQDAMRGSLTPKGKMPAERTAPPPACGSNVLNSGILPVAPQRASCLSENHPPTSPAFAFGLGPLDQQATDPLTITQILAGCPHTVAERASWSRRGSYADHAAQFPEASANVSHGSQIAEVG